jgi:hypothetical protein
MRTEEEVQENIVGSKEKLQENLNNQNMFAQGGIMTKSLAAQYEKTRAYMRGWIAFLEGKDLEETSDEYIIGYENADKWYHNTDGVNTSPTITC